MTAVDLGSFSKASEVVGYTQSGLTHLVNSLEREIGFLLIVRSHNGISLTEQGRELVPAIRQFLQANANLENRIQAIAKQQMETIRIAALCEYGDVLDAGNSLSVSTNLPECRCGSAHGGSRARAV